LRTPSAAQETVVNIDTTGEVASTKKLPAKPASTAATVARADSQVVRKLSARKSRARSIPAAQNSTVILLARLSEPQPELATIQPNTALFAVSGAC